jgi:hypothetical protein
MAHAHNNVYAKPAHVKYHDDVDEIFIYCGDSHLCMKAIERMRVALAKAVSP